MRKITFNNIKHLILFMHQSNIIINYEGYSQLNK